jgi:hypothetical protein
VRVPPKQLLLLLPLQQAWPASHLLPLLLLLVPVRLLLLQTQRGVEAVGYLCPPQNHKQGRQLSA